MEGLRENKGKLAVFACQKMSALCLGWWLGWWVVYGEAWRMLDRGASDWSSSAMRAGGLHSSLSVLVLAWVYRAVHQDYIRASSKDSDSCHPFGRVGIFLVGNEGVVAGMEKA